MDGMIETLVCFVMMRRPPGSTRGRSSAASDGYKRQAPALAAGNAVVLKPADLTPSCAHLLAQVLEAAGCPPGVFNLVMGRGSEIGAALTGHPDVAAVTALGLPAPTEK